MQNLFGVNILILANSWGGSFGGMHLLEDRIGKEMQILPFEILSLDHESLAGLSKLIISFLVYEVSTVDMPFSYLALLSLPFTSHTITNQTYPAVTTVFLTSLLLWA